MSKVVHNTIRNYAQYDAVAHFFLLLHQTIDGVVECRIATEDNDGTVSVAYHHTDKTVYTCRTFALNHIESDVVYFKATLYTFPTLLWTAQQSAFRAIKYAPFLFVYHIYYLV